jgi:hypothetical protein
MSYDCSVALNLLILIGSVVYFQSLLFKEVKVSDNKKLSTREWCFVIAILSLIQFFIHWVSYQFGNSPNALGYVSFAGTLVSIMLGLIAIIYSFVQSISQSTSVVEIREQVERLIVAGNEISESGKIIHSASQEVNGLVGDLASKVTENTTTTKEVLGSVSKLTSELNSSSMHRRETDIAQIAPARPGEGGSIIDSERVIARLMILCIYESAKRNYTISKAESLLLVELAKKLKAGHSYLIGAFTSVLFAVEAEGHTEFPDVDTDTTEITMSEEFNARVRDVIPETMNGDQKYYNIFWQVINELDSDEEENQAGETT